MLPLPEVPPDAVRQSVTPAADQLQRPLRDLRISVTDRCNFRCTYCMPRQSFGPGHRFLPSSALLSFEEIERVCRLLVPMGVRKLRLTGGEPLMRKELDKLVAALARLRTPDGQALDLAMTTNGSLLPAHASRLKQAGLKRLSVSLDALDDTIFQRMNDAGYTVGEVLRGIEAAQQAGFTDIKVNMVVQRGVNEGQILPMVNHFRHTGIELRFIEFMDVGATNGWQDDAVFSAQHMHDTIAKQHPLRPLSPRHPGETARRYALQDGSGQLGFIASVTQAFCSQCNRLRLTTDGQLFTCLFGAAGTDLRSVLRGNACDAEIQARLGALWASRSDRYSELRQAANLQVPGAQAMPSAPHRAEMSYIGG